MGLGFRVGRGVRIYGGGRGLGVSVGTGRVRYYKHIGGGTRSRGPGGASIAAHERQVRQAQRLQDIQRVIDLDKQLIALCQAHRQEFGPSERPVAPLPEPVNKGEIKKRLESEATAGISAFKFGQRRAAKRGSLTRLEEEIRAEEEQRAQGAQRLQSQLADQWARLQANDADTVLAALEAAFEDNEAPAAAVSCRDDRVDIVIRWPAVGDVVPERKAAVTPSGQPTVHKRNRTEQAELYLEALCSHTLVTAKEAFAECPAINEVGLAAIRARQDPARGDDIVEPLLLATVRREQLDGIRWENVVAIAALLETATGKVGMKGKGANKTLYGLDLSEDQEERAFIGQVAAGLAARVPEGGIPGLALPVDVVVAT
ncbi:MAG: hypothetical protein ACRDH8_04070 [Actinomycetota bacterium]